jgi:hypothetical protein
LYGRTAVILNMSSEKIKSPWIVAYALVQICSIKWVLKFLFKL